MNGLKKIQALFHNQKANIAYLTAGDGGATTTVQAALALIEGGVNLLEIGVPFSDPIADGPVIQQASARALQNGTHLKQVLEIVRTIRSKSAVPMILFSYYNPILAALSPTFFQELVEAGVDGLLIVDCPLEESEDLEQECLEHELAFIPVITPSTPMDRVALMTARAHGFLYYACRKGTTGMKSNLPDDFPKKMTSLKSTTSVPIVVGFGISDRATAAQVLEKADGVVIGSLFVKALADGMGFQELTSLAKSIYSVCAKK